MMESANESGNKSAHEKVYRKRRRENLLPMQRTELLKFLLIIKILHPQNQREIRRKGRKPRLRSQEFKGGTKNLVDKAKEQNIPSQEWIVEKIMKMVPDFEEHGMEDPESTLRPVASYLRPKLDFQPFLNIQLYEKALDLLKKTHEPRIRHNKLNNGIEVEETSDLKIAPLDPGDRISIVCCILYSS